MSSAPSQRLSRFGAAAALVLGCGSAPPRTPDADAGGEAPGHAEPDGVKNRPINGSAVLADTQMPSVGKVTF